MVLPRIGMVLGMCWIVLVHIFCRTIRGGGTVGIWSVRTSGIIVCAIAVTGVGVAGGIVGSVSNIAGLMRRRPGAVGINVAAEEGAESGIGSTGIIMDMSV